MPTIEKSAAPARFQMMEDVESYGVRADGVPESIARAEVFSRESAAPVAGAAEGVPAARSTRQPQDGVDDEPSWLDEALGRANQARKVVSHGTKAVKTTATVAASRALTVAHSVREVATQPGLAKDATKAAMEIASRTEGLMRETSTALRVADTLGKAAYWGGVVANASKIAEDVIDNRGPTRASVMPGLDLAVGAVGQAAPNPLVKSFSVGWSVGRAADSAVGLSDGASDLAITATGQRVRTDIRGTLANSEYALGSDAALDDLVARLATGKATNSDRGAVRHLLHEARTAGVLRDDGSIDKGRARELVGWWADGDLVDAIRRAQIAEKFL